MTAVFLLKGILIGLLFGIPVGAVKRLSGWIACFPKARLAGTVFGGGADAAGAIHGHPALDKAYEMGKAI